MLTDGTTDMVIIKEETFGPGGAALPFQDRRDRIVVYLFGTEPRFGHKSELKGHKRSSVRGSNFPSQYFCKASTKIWSSCVA